MAAIMTMKLYVLFSHHLGRKRQVDRLRLGDADIKTGELQDIDKRVHR